MLYGIIAESKEAWFEIIQQTSENERNSIGKEQYI